MPSCKHYWQLDSPNGPTSPGRCTRCGVTDVEAGRTFRNDMSGLHYGRFVNQKGENPGSRQVQQARRAAVARSYKRKVRKDG